MYFLDFHGDDYGVSHNNCKRFIEIAKLSKIDSISIIPNMDFYQDGIKMIKEEWDSFTCKPKLSVHINLIDGYSLSNSSNTMISKKLASGKRAMSASWGKLLIMSFIPGKKHDELKRAIVEEIRAQLHRAYSDLPEDCELRIDSHLHTHMIPIVCDAMIVALEKEQLKEKVKFIRVSREPLFPFFITSGVMGTFPIINILKNVILNLLSNRVEGVLKRNNIPYGCIFGVILTGNMNLKRVEKIIPRMCEYLKRREAKNKSCYMEVVCHPGIVSKDEVREEFGKDDMHAFYSDYRNVEYDMLINRVL